MKKSTKTLLIFLIIFLFLPAASAHEQKIPVVIDTDMALDDARAIVLLLASPHIHVKAIVTSDGASSPEKGAENLLRILAFLGKNDIPVASGISLNETAPKWRQMSESLAENLPVSQQKPHPDAQALLLKILSESEEKTNYICLGPMSNLAGLISDHPSAKERISNVLYYGSSPQEKKVSWNTARDTESAQKVFASGLTVYLFDPKEEQLFDFDTDFFEKIQKTDTLPAKLLSLIHESEAARKLIQEKHFKCWDETISVYALYPELADFVQPDANLPIRHLEKWDTDKARAAYLEILAQSHEFLPERMPVVLKHFPTNPREFQDDLALLVPEIITAHGPEEWKHVVLTNELHRHLGTYSIIGAKMGIRAREILSASLDEVRVESSAGSKPPLSCLNDGLQVSTGASLGRGTIAVLEKNMPEALFIHGDKRIVLKLKEEIRQQIQADIQAAIKNFGNLTPAYFDQIRKLSIQHWLKMSRTDIFEETFLNKGEEK
ncbi:MAG: nucleoside hydrolase [Desulfobacterales bacterium]